jgi:hypothetical protein
MVFHRRHEAPGASFLEGDPIRFIHPGYTALPSAVLFSLPRVDSVDTTNHGAPVAGVHHGTALVACQIVANNAFDGRLALDSEGEHMVDEIIGHDGILTEREYYFFVPGDSKNLGVSFKF